MAHVPIDKVLYVLSGESGARPSIDLAARIPGSSRVSRTRAKSGRQATVKGLSRGAVVKVRISPREYHIRVKGSRDYVGQVIKQDNSHSAYGYRLKGADKTVPGYKTQEEAVKAMLTRV